MKNKNTIKSLLTFTESQNPTSSFIVIYIMTWLAWHNQIITHFLSAHGDFLTKISTAFKAIDDNQYVVVFLLTTLIFIIRLVISYAKFRSQEIIDNTDETFTNARSDQKFAKSNDISTLMDTLSKAQQQLAESRDREKKLITEKNTAMKKILSLQNELEEAKADITLLSSVKATN